MASSMAGAMAGSVIGHGISRAIFGGGENEAVAATSPAEIQQQQSQMPVQQDGQQMCSVQAKGELACCCFFNAQCSYRSHRLYYLLERE